MNYIRRLVVDDRISAGLLAGALASVLAALVVTAISSRSTLSGQRLDRVRGANPAWYRGVNMDLPNCTAIEVASLSSTGAKVVGYLDCNAATLGWTCIQCPPIVNYQLFGTPGTRLAFPKPVQGVDCEGDPSNTGTCGWLNANITCLLTGGYDCTQYAFNYSLEP